MTPDCFLFQSSSRYLNAPIFCSRVKDFKGISNKGFDGYGNYNLGIKEQIIFMEIDYDKVSQILKAVFINLVTVSIVHNWHPVGHVRIMISTILKKVCYGQNTFGVKKANASVYHKLI